MHFIDNTHLNNFNWAGQQLMSGKWKVVQKKNRQTKHKSMHHYNLGWAEQKCKAGVTDTPIVLGHAANSCPREKTTPLKNLIEEKN